MKRVIVVSPYKGDIERNVKYAQDAMHDSMGRGEAPFASHLMYPGCLNNGVAQQRELGFKCERVWMGVADYIAVYYNFGVSSGMQSDIDDAGEMELPIVWRLLDAYPRN